MQDQPTSTSKLRSVLLRIALPIAIALGAPSGSADESDPAVAPVVPVETVAPSAPTDAKGARPAATAPSPGDAPLLLNVDGDGLALQGYDPVAYFVDGRATLGDARWQSTRRGAVYRFASDDHKRRFDADPVRYEPAFGGYCAYGASIDKLVPIDPKVFQIEDGRLLLQYDRGAYDRFNADARTNLDRADAKWPGLVSKYGTEDGKPSAANRLRLLIGF